MALTTEAKAELIAILTPRFEEAKLLRDAARESVRRLSANLARASDEQNKLQQTVDRLVAILSTLSERNGA